MRFSMNLYDLIHHGVCMFVNLQSHRSIFSPSGILVLFDYLCRFFGRLAKQQEEEGISSEKPSRAMKHHARGATKHTDGKVDGWG